MKKIKFMIIVFLSSVLSLCVCGEEKCKNPTGLVVHQLSSRFGSASERMSEVMDMELVMFPEQSLSQRSILFSVKVYNRGEKAISFEALAFLDGCQIILRHKDDPSISLPENIRSRVNPRGDLPLRPYTLSGWRIITENLGEVISTNELNKAILGNNNLDNLRNEKIEIPALSALIIDFDIQTLVKATRLSSEVPAKDLGIVEGDYALEVSIPIIFYSGDSSKKDYLIFSTDEPVTIMISQAKGQTAAERVRLPNASSRSQPTCDAEEVANFQVPKVGKEETIPDHVKSEPLKPRSSILRSWKTILPALGILLVVIGLGLRRRV